MSQTILLVDYEPRTVARVTEALAPIGCQVVVAKDVDAAVAACAQSEPRAVLITSVLPRVKVEDAITQLRARAGLRHTPILVLMSGYTGGNPVEDAAKLGAQDIVAKPFANEELLAHARALLQTTRGSVTPDTRADVLEALRRSAGLASDTGTMTSQELFGDLLESEPATVAARSKPAVPTLAPADPPPTAATPPPDAAGKTQRIQINPAMQATPPADTKPTRPADRRLEPDTAARKLETTLADMLEQPTRPKPREDTGGASVDELLSQTLSGLQVQPRKPAPRPAIPPPSTDPPPEPAAPPAVAAEPEPAAVVVAPPAPPAPPLPAPAPPPVTPPSPAASARPGKGEASLSVGTPFGQYELIEPIATGGMAEVYKARMRGVEGFQKIVAIKRILPHLTDNDEFVTMFIDEAKLAAQLQHPNIIHIYDLGKIERSYYIAMEYIDGKDLRSLLRVLDEKSKRMPLGEALYVGSRLATALDYAHRKKDMQGRAMALVHRDVSPQNVLISFDGDIKLCDFGIAKAASKASHTRAGALKGKLQYMSPEQAWGKDIDHRSDIFSLGLVVYEMVTGRKAFAGDSELSILEQVRSPRLVGPRELDPAIPAEVERVVLKALKEKREERYQTAAELASDLDAILATIRPVPGAAELGDFLTELAGRERSSSAAAAPTARPAAPTATPTPPSAAPTPDAPPLPAADLPTVEVSQIMGPPRRIGAPLFVGLGVVVVAVAAYFLFLGPKARPSADESASQTPIPVAEHSTADADAPALDVTAPSEIVPAAAVLTEPPVRPAVILPTRPAEPAAVQARPTPAPQAPSAVAAPADEPPAAIVEPTAVPTAVAERVPEPTAAPLERPTSAPAQSQPTVREGQLVEITEVDAPPQAISTPKPAYPPLAARQRIGGTVILKVLVNHTGAVEDVQVLRGIKPDLGLDKAAQNAIRTWRYKPATKDGVRVKVWVTQTIPFVP